MAESSHGSPASWPRITTIDAHTAGEPLRIVTGGYPPLPGSTMLAKRRHARDHHDDLRRLLMLEPRGHADMYGAVLTDPVTDDGDVGVLFLHNEGYSTMCGHGIIAVVKVGLEQSLFATREAANVKIDTPAGRVTATPHWSDTGSSVASVSFLNVPSFVLARNVVLNDPELGELRCDIAYGGAFYAYVDVNAIAGERITLEPSSTERLIACGRRIKDAAAAAHPPVHPEGDADLGFIYGTIFYDDSAAGCRSRNVCIFADGEVDRSPTGTGVSGRAALLHAGGELDVDDPIVIESILGTTMTVRVSAVTSVDDVPAVVPEVSGTAHVTGHHEFVVDPADPLRDGIFLR